MDGEGVLSYASDLIQVLKNKKDINSLMQSLDDVNTLRSSTLSDLSHIQNQLSDYQKKISACKRNIDEAAIETVADEELDRLQHELEEQLREQRAIYQELRVINDEISDLDCQSIAVEEQKESLMKIERDEIRQQKKLSMYASVTNIIPELGDKMRISGRNSVFRPCGLDVFTLGRAFVESHIPHTSSAELKQVVAKEYLEMRGRICC